MMVLFGGGDGGGIYIDANSRLHRIPPWDPQIMAQLKAANALTSAADRLATADVGKELHTIAERLTSSVVPQVARSVGGIAVGENAVAFIDGDDGFTCGSTGKHPIPFPIPHGVTQRVTTAKSTGAATFADREAPRAGLNAG